MPPRPHERAHHIKDSIKGIRAILSGKSLDEARTDIAVWPAFERYLEIICEAAKHIPGEWQHKFGPDIPWQQIVDTGNQLRHVYHRTNAQALWEIYTGDLDPLEAAIDAMLAANPSPTPPSSS